MTVIPELIASPEQAYRELGRVRSLIADRVDPVCGLVLAAVQDWIVTSHPALESMADDDALADAFPAHHGWPLLRVDLPEYAS